MITLLVSLLLVSSAFACDFSSKVRSVYSLSGPVTLALQDLKLLKNKKLKAISVFHPISKNEFKGEFLPGGVFLSHDTIKGLAGSVVFFDESRELSKILARYKEVKAVEIKTRSLTPLQVTERLEKQLQEFLPDCPLPQLKTSVETKLSELKKLIPPKKSFLFFLGLIQGTRLPEMLMVNDGVIKWLKDEKLIETYPTHLPYVNWSARILHELPANTYRIGIKDSGSEMSEKLEKKDHILNLTFPGALIPGRGQVDGMLYLFRNL